MRKLIWMLSASLAMVAGAYGAGCLVSVSSHSVTHGSVSKVGLQWQCKMACSCLDGCANTVDQIQCDFEHYYDWYRWNAMTSSWSLIGIGPLNDYPSVTCNNSKAASCEYTVGDILQGNKKFVHHVDGTSGTLSWYSTEEEFVTF
jgi:hypothetical protein